MLGLTMRDRETIPDTAHVVRHLLKSEWDEYHGQVVVSMHAFYDPELSVDWLEKTSLEESYSRKPKSEAHAVFVVGRLRSIGDESVQHKPETGNYSHSEVVCTGPLVKGKQRPPAACRAFMMSIERTEFRPPPPREESVQEPPDAPPPGPL